MPSFIAFMMIFSSPVACSSSVGIPDKQTKSLCLQKAMWAEEKCNVVENLVVSIECLE